MESTGHHWKDVISAATLADIPSVDAFHEIQEFGQSEVSAAHFTNDEVDLNQGTAIGCNEAITTDQAAICVICLDLVLEKAIALPCRHDYFHFSCLGTWLQQNRSCPLCKADILSIRYDGGKTQSTGVFQLPASVPSQSSQGRQRRQELAHSRHRYRNDERNSASTEESRSLQVRRRVYECQLYSLYVGNNRISRYRNITPALFRSDSRLIPRAKRWIRRELRALDPFDQYTAEPCSATSMTRNTEFRNNEFLLEYVIAVLKYIDLKGSAGQAEILLREHLGSTNARLFLHELENWLRSPFDRLEVWDEYVQYSQV